MKNIIGLLLVMGFISCGTVEPEVLKGSLIVNVTIGPLCPVEPCKKTDAELKQIYEAYSLVFTNVSTGTIALEKALSYNGTLGILNQTELPVGDYKIDVKPANMFSGLPKDVKIENGKTTTMDLKIDTGIR
ncbi:hypothetical protein [Lacihabitans sp. LS3-19]|uniref:hypothetical protein n=1 Tax=Lacihabitans sp. LS3-19 TaxID=2487335 RepID=UPI0020CC2346|nr:hypothetical protein [Lacihabitans sp. LS3-19]